MRNFDLTPLYRSTVGFDRFASMLDQVLTADSGQPSYPPYNIEKTGEDAYRITLAVAGFSMGDLDIEARDGLLVVKGGKAPAKSEDAPVYLHRGIAERSFERRFQLADHVHVTGAALENGLLHVDLVHELPEALKPRKIEIGGQKAIESESKGKARADA
ncbi:Hsp20 family protein [Pikeienuella sp. HZG-20]|uniref:Hsp20 family protein n=1 Tax=Paludibacillus litoralis TaxID=3133267 RepID=UPI0030EECB3E